MPTIMCDVVKWSGNNRMNINFFFFFFFFFLFFFFFSGLHHYECVAPLVANRERERERERERILFATELQAYQKGYKPI